MHVSGWHMYMSVADIYMSTVDIYMTIIATHYLIWYQISITNTSTTAYSHWLRRWFTASKESWWAASISVIRASDLRKMEDPNDDSPKWVWVVETSIQYIGRKIIKRWSVHVAHLAVGVPRAADSRIVISWKQKWEIQNIEHHELTFGMINHTKCKCNVPSKVHRCSVLWMRQYPPATKWSPRRAQWVPSRSRRVDISWSSQPVSGSQALDPAFQTQSESPASHLVWSAT